MAEKGGFNFDFCARNQFLQDKLGVKPPKTKKTGTTIAGALFKDGVILGADTRATEGSIVCDKNCEKIHYISSKIYCCGAGTSGDLESTTGLISSQLELHRQATNKDPRVVTAMTMFKQTLFRYQGHVSAALVLGGVDETGPHLYTVYPHGSTDYLPYGTMGSGSLAAMSVFESSYREDMSEEEGINLVADAIRSGIFNDLGSGSNVDICVITKDGTKMLRNYDRPNERLYRKPDGYSIPRGYTEVLSEKIQNFKNHIDIEDMEISA